MPNFLWWYFKLFVYVVCTLLQNIAIKHIVQTDVKAENGIISYVHKNMKRRFSVGYSA